jgi:hypothetical protein
MISTLNYPSLERRLAAMRLTGQIATGEAREGRSRPYAATPWLRRAIGPIVSAARWERQFAPDTATPVMPIDVESTLLLTLPLLRLPEDLNGTARFAVQLRHSDGSIVQAGAMARVEGGAVVSCSSRLEGPADAWISGSVGDWLDAAMTGGAGNLEGGGDCDLVRALIDGIRDVLFDDPNLISV